MLRYLGLVWNDANPQQRETAQLILCRLQRSSSDWQPHFSASGIQVFCIGTPAELERTLRLPGNAGILIGTAFARNRDVLAAEPHKPLQLTVADSADIVHGNGRWLIEHSWGNYVAFGYNNVDQKKWVLKDPTGSLPCLRTVFRDVTIVFSNIEDCLGLQLQRFTVSDEFLRAHMMADASLQEISPLQEVITVRRGECVEFKRGNGPWGLRKLQWSPLAFTGADQLIENADLAARAMRNTVQSATSSWVSVHPSMLLRLSGGLDSSIISGCLHNAPGKSRFAAYTYFTPQGRSDERPWAKLAAEMSGCEHIEYPLSPAQIDLRVALQMAPTLEPSSLLAFFQRTVIEQTLASTCDATAVFNGDGGDSGFCSDSLAHAVPEYLQNHGPVPGVFRLASQVALLTERSSWSVLTDAVRRLLGNPQRGIPHQRLMAACQLVSPSITADYKPKEAVSHVWFQHLRSTPWDKIRRLGTLVSSPDYYNVAAPPGAIVPEIISPLYAQPVIELLLRIPIYTHFHGGRDRGLARTAFTGAVPEQILRRLWKDRAPGFHDELLERQRAFLKETLLEGTLVAHGLLDRTRVEQALSTAPSKSTVLSAEVFRHLDTELWARQWLGSTRQQAVA